MFENKFKYLAAIISYGFFLIIIIICVNSVLPEDEIPVLEQKNEIVVKIENDFSRNKNSAYEILENSQKSNFLENEKKKQKNRDQEILYKKGKEKEDKFRLQFASFKEKIKSEKITKELESKFSDNSIEISLKVKRVKINENDIFFRIISKEKYTYDNAKKNCKRLIEQKYKCIIIRD